MNTKKILILYFLLIVASSAQTQETPIINSPSFGSQKILDKVWPDKEELQGSTNDKKIITLSPPDLNPPDKRDPQILHDPLVSRLRNSIRSVIPYNGDKIIALTFDLCEKANEKTGYDADIVNILRRERVKATFFAGGKWMRSHEEKTMQLMADPLFELGAHGWTHGNLAVLRGNKMIEQILWTQAQYELIWNKLREKVLSLNLDLDEMNKIPPSLTLFRPPYGRCNSEALEILAEYGLASIQWSVVSGDPAKSQTPQKIVNTVLHQAKPGAIVIFHGNGRGYGTARALPIIINSLRAENYKFVTVSELLQAGKIEAAKDCYEVTPGDNQRYDRIFGTGTGEQKGASAPAQERAGSRMGGRQQTGAVGEQARSYEQR